MTEFKDTGEKYIRKQTELKKLENELISINKDLELKTKKETEIDEKSKKFSDQLALMNDQKEKCIEKFKEIEKKQKDCEDLVLRVRIDKDK